MASLVDFTILDSIIGDDQNIRQELFEAFLESSSKCLTCLHDAFSAHDSTSWRKQAHALKGLCFDFGAGDLGNLCKHAEKNCEATEEEKQAMLVKIAHDLALVQKEIHARM